MVAIASITQIGFNGLKMKKHESVNPFADRNFAPAPQNPDVFVSKNKSANISFKGLALKPGLFRDVAVNESHPDWLKFIAREIELYAKPNETRPEFSRDYDRVIHSSEYKKLYGKTQVFMNPRNSIVTTRGPHSTQVASVSENLCEFFGLTPILGRAVGIAHDLGHTPLGHDGERAIDKLSMLHLGVPFWHEKHSLRVVDDIATKADMQGYHRNLDLTYAVRDGIVSHSGEIDEIGLMRRKDYIDLRSISQFEKRPASTWEGCTDRIGDKIGYLGEDIEVALYKKVLQPKDIKELIKTIKRNTGVSFDDVNSSVLINKFVGELCTNSDPDKGIRFSEEGYEVYKAVKKFNKEKIYIPAANKQTPYIELIINTIFEDLNKLYDGPSTLKRVNKAKETRPVLMADFREWLVKYSDVALKERESKKYANKILYKIDNQRDYKLATLEYIASMVDKSAIEAFEEIMY